MCTRFVLFLGVKKFFDLVILKIKNLKNVHLICSFLGVKKFFALVIIEIKLNNLKNLHLICTLFKRVKFFQDLVILTEPPSLPSY
jgi:hypothetical protein